MYLKEQQVDQNTELKKKMTKLRKNNIKNLNLLQQKDILTLLNLFFKNGNKNKSIKVFFNIFQILRYKLIQSKLYVSPLFITIKALKNLNVGLVLKTVLVNKKQKQKKKQKNLYIPFELTPVQALKNSFKTLVKTANKTAKKSKIPISLVLADMIFDTFLRKGVAIKQKLYFQKFLASKQNWHFKFSRYKLPPKLFYKKKNKFSSTNKVINSNKRSKWDYKNIYDNYHRKINKKYITTVYQQFINE